MEIITNKKEEVTEEIWSLPCLNYILYRNSNLPKEEYRWFEEISSYYGNDPAKKETMRSRLMGKGWIEKKDKISYLFLAPWELDFEANTKNDKEWKKELSKYPKWNKLEYFKVAAIGDTIFRTDGSDLFKNEGGENYKRRF